MRIAALPLLAAASAAQATAPSCHLSARPSTITEGGPATLSWTTSHATGFSVAGIGALPLSGSMAIAPPATQRYVGTATGQGSVTCSATVTVQPPRSGWQDMGTVSGVVSNYTPVVVISSTSIRVYQNTNGTTDGDYWLRSGTWSSVGVPLDVLHIAVARDTYIRTSGVARGASGTYYAVLYTGDGYPTQGGCSPSWATSPDGITWTWDGPIGIFGRNQSSAAALIVDESRTDAYRFMAWLDGVGPQLTMMHSATGAVTDWQSDGLNMWPIAGDSPQFCSAARDSYGYHLICANQYPATAMRHLWSCDGLKWSVLEMAAPIINTSSGKGTNLAFDPSTGVLHALTSGTHWQTAQEAWPCPCGTSTSSPLNGMGDRAAKKGGSLQAGQSRVGAVMVQGRPSLPCGYHPKQSAASGDGAGLDPVGVPVLGLALDQPHRLGLELQRVPRSRSLRHSPSPCLN
jgi:hypothetical protein